MYSKMKELCMHFSFNNKVRNHAFYVWHHFAEKDSR